MNLNIMLSFNHDKDRLSDRVLSFRLATRDDRQRKSAEGKKSTTPRPKPKS